MFGETLTRYGWYSNKPNGGRRNVDMICRLVQ